MNEINQANQDYLLKAARETLEKFVREGDPPAFGPKDGVLSEKRSCFVTLKKDGKLRGCIGSFDPKESLIREVSRLTIAAASEDPRFSPVREEELARIKIEISVLSPLERVESWIQIEVGRHGIAIEHGAKRGVFLPEVALEMNWTAEKFVKCCAEEKAGISQGALAQAKLFRFYSEKIKER